MNVAPACVPDCVEKAAFSASISAFGSPEVSPMMGSPTQTIRTFALVAAEITESTRDEWIWCHNAVFGCTMVLPD